MNLKSQESIDNIKGIRIPLRNPARQTDNLVKKSSSSKKIVQGVKRLILYTTAKSVDIYK